MNKPKILVVEDNPVEQKLICLLAARFGVDVDMAATAYKALQLIEQHNHYSAVLMNYMLPAMNGVECTRIIRQQKTSLPIIAVTAAVLDEAREECLQGGMDDYLAKPYTIEQFGSVLKRWVREQPYVSA